MFYKERDTMTREEKIEKLINIISQLNNESINRLNVFAAEEVIRHNQESCQANRQT